MFFESSIGFVEAKFRVVCCYCSHILFFAIVKTKLSSFQPRGICQLCFPLNSRITAALLLAEFFFFFFSIHVNMAVPRKQVDSVNLSNTISTPWKSCSYCINKIFKTSIEFTRYLLVFTVIHIQEYRCIHLHDYKLMISNLLGI